MNEFDEFVQSLIDNKDKKLLMTHLPLAVRYCRKYFDGYLTSDELSERQFTGRFWDIISDGYAPTTLYVILDNDTVLAVYKDIHGKYVEGIGARGIMNIVLPETLRGRYYND